MIELLAGGSNGSAHFRADLILPLIISSARKNGVPPCERAGRATPWLCSGSYPHSIRTLDEAR
eukprot:10537772-Prorocentrum_lima.AAC.1